MTTTTPSTAPNTAADHIQKMVNAFRDDGFVHIPQALSVQEVARLHDAARAAITGDEAAKRNDEAGIVSTVDAWEHNDTLRDFALHSRLGPIAEHLAGMPLRVWGGEVLIKTPNDTRPTGLHDDETCAPLDSRITLNAWVALVDVPVERGCLTFLPGSHRRGGPERIDMTGINFADLIRDDAHGYLFDHWPDLRWTPRVTMPMRAGDVTFHHRRTAHSAGANQTPDDRVSLVISYTDAEATYQPRPGHDPLPYQPGQALPADRYPRVSQ